MNRYPVLKIVKQRDWLDPLAEKSDALVKNALDSVGDAGETARHVLVNSRLMGHTRHPTITDIPFGSWTVTLVSDVLAAAGQQDSSVADVSLLVGLVASLIASAGGLADLSETRGKEDRRIGTLHGIFQGVTTLLYGGSFLARRKGSAGIGRALGFAGYGTLLVASYLANQLAEKRKAAR